MIKRTIPYLISIIAVTSPLMGANAPPAPMMMPDERGIEIVVNNRILAKVNNKAITVVDVQKKMDMLFLQMFPEYAASKIARCQFYNVNWKSCLDDLINKELVLADAEEMKMKATNGDVRQEVESMFGPNVISNLDKVGMSLDEAWDLVKKDIQMRRMMMARVNVKAMQQVYPQDVRKAYDDYLTKFDRSQQYVYQMISVRDKNVEAGKTGASKISELLIGGAVPLSDVVSYVKDHKLVSESSTVNLSEVYTHHEKDISDQYKEVLSAMQPNSFSQPIETSSRNEKKAVIYRIFYLKDIEQKEPLPFSQMAIKLKEQLTNEMVSQETVKYLKKLRDHYVVKDEEIMKNLPKNFEPFSLNKQ
jgi:hypothetical protein